MSDPFRAAAWAYLIYGIVYFIGGLYLISQGIGVMGARTPDATADTMLYWGLLGAIPLVLIPWLLSRPWSMLGGLVSRRTFAWVVAVLLAIRVYKVSEVAIRGGASVAAPWGGEISFQAGAIVFLVLAVIALGFVLRAATYRQRPLP
jgi:hypothetical protein